MSSTERSVETLHWRAEHIACLVTELPTLPLIEVSDASPILPDRYVWDAWPITDPAGRTARFDGREYWMMLSSPVLPDPLMRHDLARLRLLARGEDGWHDRGDLLPDGLSPGLREWAGSAIWDAGAERLHLLYTVAGRSGEPISFEQRLFGTTARFDGQRFADWTTPAELLPPDPRWYMDTRTTQGAPGMIKGYRDPAWFRDPCDGTAYLTFAASDARSSHMYNGVAGMARLADGVWEALPPLVSADGFCNELERPHLLARDGRYYLFWSTQRHVFAPGPSGPNGLYGAVAEHVLGPYRLLNGSGLVAANPLAEPYQAYSWLVLDTLEVVSFVDFWGLRGRSKDDPMIARAQFGGTPAPRFTLSLSGDRAAIA